MKTALFLLPVLSLTLTAAESGSWPAFRGPNSSGISASAKPPVKIGPKEGVLWSIDVPWAPSSPSVWGERIFLTTFAGERLETRAYSTKDGSLLWKKISPVEKFEEFHRTEGSPDFWKATEYLRGAAEAAGLEDVKLVRQPKPSHSRPSAACE